MSKLMYRTMFEEELDRKERALKALKQAVNESEYTKLTVKTIKGIKYLYGYSPRLGKYVYLGKYNKELMAKYQETVNDRLLIQKQIDEVNEDIPAIKNILKCL